MRHIALFLAPVIGIVAGLSWARGDTVETDTNSPASDAHASSQTAPSVLRRMAAA